MAPRSIWKGAINFGLVVIPVKMYGATEEKAVRFHQLHRECKSRIQMPRYCPQCDRRLESGEIARGYEVSKGQYVLIEDQEFETLPLKTLKTAEVVEFVNGQEIDPRHYDKAYFLSPEDTGIKAFWLFLRAMERMGLVAVAKLCYRDREHLATIKPFGKVLLLQTLFWSDELRSPAEVEPAETAVSDKELAMAARFIEAMAKDHVDLSQFHDEYRGAVVRLIEAKLAGEIIEAVPVEAKPTYDLSAALEASLAEILEKKGVRV